MRLIKWLDEHLEETLLAAAVIQKNRNLPVKVNMPI